MVSQLSRQRLETLKKIARKKKKKNCQWREEDTMKVTTLTMKKDAGRNEENN
jgi:hypothetical protein